MIGTRSETEQGIASTRQFNEQAVGGREEAHIVDQLLAQPGETLSLVAEAENAASLDRIFFSPVTHRQGWRAAFCDTALPSMARNDIEPI